MVDRFTVRRSAVLAVPMVLVLVALSGLLAGCSGDSAPRPAAATTTPSDSPSDSPSDTATGSSDPSGAPTPSAPVPAPFRHPIPGMPAVRDGDVYAATRWQSQEQARVRHVPAYLYVPNSYGAPITTVIDQRTHKVVRILHTGMLQPARHAVVGPAPALRRGERVATRSTRSTPAPAASPTATRWTGPTTSTSRLTASTRW